MENLNKLELEILFRASLRNPKIKDHIQYLKVEKREYTGVGAFVYFAYSYILNIVKLEPDDGFIGFNDTVKIPTLQNGLCCEVSIKGGKLSYIELVTIGENWDGSITGFYF